MAEKYYVYRDGQYFEMSESDVDAIKAANQKEFFEQLTKDSKTAEELLWLVLNNYDVTTPGGEVVTVSDFVNSKIDLPVKLGYKWELVFNGNGFVYQQVEDPDAIGTSAENYIVYDFSSDSNVPLINNAFYKRYGKIQVYMDGQWADWDV